MSEEFARGMIEANKAFQEAVTREPDVFMEIATNNTGMYFDGLAPIMGDTCEMVCVGRYIDYDGNECFKFKLRVKDSAA